MPRRTSVPAATPHADGAIDLKEFLRAMGYGAPAAMRSARGVLESAGLTNPRKQALAAYKRPAAEAALRKALVPVCGAECAALAPRGRKPVVTDGAGCEVCRGSNNRRAALTCIRRLAQAKVTRVLVVGGTAPQQSDLRELLAAPGLSVEFVDGMARSHTQKDAIANMKRVQLVVIWGPTPLRHAVSNHYTTAPPPGVAVITVARRGIEALCNAVIRHYAGGR